MKAKKKTVQRERKPNANQKKTTDMSGEDLAILLDRNYQQLEVCKQNIFEIRTELQRRAKLIEPQSD